MGVFRLTELSPLLKVKYHPKLSRYENLCWNFILYLRDKENIQLHIEGYDNEKSDFVDMTKPYMHRWKQEYLKARLAKLYLLDAWAKNQTLPLSMLTFTTYHDSIYAYRKIGQRYSIEQSWDILKAGFWKTSMLIRNKIRKRISYFWIVEPQIKSGYPHIHAGYFTEFSDNEKDRLKTHWSKILKAGNYYHGLDFSFKSDYQSGDISSFRNYLMKYMGKTFIDTMPNWEPEELVFNAIAWKGRYRFFGCSRNLSIVMKRKKKVNPNFTWLCTTMHRPDRGFEEDKIIRKNPTWEKVTN